MRRHGEIGALLRLGFPVMLTQVGVIAVGFADTIMVGHYGVKELAAAAFVNSVFLIPSVMLMGLAAGITPLAGALFGRGESEAVGRVARGGLQINLIVAAILTAVMGTLYFFLDKFGQPEELMPLIREYYLIILCTLLPMAVFNSWQQTANGMTDTATPMWVMLLSVAVNILGNRLLIFGAYGFPELGLAGAGLATLMARLIAAGGIMAVVFIWRRYRECASGYRLARCLGEIRRKVWVTSYPVMIQSGVECSLWTVGAVVCGWFGTIQLAAYQVMNTIGQLGFMIFMSFGVAVAVRVANYTGLGDEAGVSRTARSGMYINMVLATLASCIFIFGGRRLLEVFTPDAAVVESAVSLILPLALYQYLDSIQLTFCNAIRGTSQVKPLLWIGIGSYIVVGVPVLMVFAKVLDMGNVGVYFSFDVALLVAALSATIVFRRLRLETPSRGGYGWSKCLKNIGN